MPHTSPPSPPQPKIALYVSSVAGKLVSRYGASRPGLQVYIGATRTPGKPDEVIWDTDAVIPIPEAEWILYSREYNRHLNSTPPGLVKRSAEDHQAYLAKLEAAQKQLAEEERSATEAARAQRHQPPAPAGTTPTESNPPS